MENLNQNLEDLWIKIKKVLRVIGLIIVGLYTGQIIGYAFMYVESTGNPVKDFIIKGVIFLFSIWVFTTCMHGVFYLNDEE